MLDFLEIQVKERKTGNKAGLVVTPAFILRKTDDLIIKGKSFYAIWDEHNNIWSTNEYDLIRLIDESVYEYVEEKFKDSIETIHINLAKNVNNRVMINWAQYLKFSPDSNVETDTKVVFADQVVDKHEYSTKRLPYSLSQTATPCYDELINTLYRPEEREKIEWTIGCILAGDHTKVHKFMVLFGGPGTGKGTVLEIVQKLFQGYCGIFDSKALGSRNESFALESFKRNPIIAIDEDGDLSRVNDNTRLNTIVSHEEVEINEKNKTKYSKKIQSFLMIASNRPVKITDSNSGLLRRLIDVQPSGNLVPRDRYNDLMNGVNFELGGIANHCLNVYKQLGINYYNGYKPLAMMVKTNDLYNFLYDNYFIFTKEYPDGVYLGQIYDMYTKYCASVGIPYPMKRSDFREELKSYFEYYKERTENARHVYIGLLTDKFNLENDEQKEKKKEDTNGWLKLDKQESLFDNVFKDCPAQYTNEDGVPTTKWAEVNKTLSDIDTSKEHFVKLPTQIINIDFDLKDEEGNKNLELNIAAASKFPPTYAETSKSGAGIHLVYAYEGDPAELSNLYDKDIEIKKSTGNSAIRRKVILCNDLPIASISSGLPLKEKKVLNEQVIKDEKHLRALIVKGLKKQVFPNTKPSIDFIYKILEDAYKSGMKYDVSDMASDIQQLAMSSSHQAQICMKMVSKMHFKSDDPSDGVDVKDGPIIFFDIEVFPNLFIVCWKKQGSNKVVKMINPTANEVESFVKTSKLVGFNNRRYDNHILWAAMMGYTNEQLFKLSQRIIEGDRNAMFGEAYGLSYTDVYEFLAAGKQMSLKKWEIKLHINHIENSYAWNEPLDESHWDEVAEYCCNDVKATEAVWDANQSDWEAREMLAELSGLTVNDTTNTHTTRIIVGKDPHPQTQFVYTDLSTIYPGYEFNMAGIDKSKYKEGTKIVAGRSLYKGLDPGEGGYAVGYPGIYYNVALLDVASMHPHSAIRLNIFGDTYTARFAEIVEARIAIKHKDYELAGKMLDGKLKPYLKDPKDAKKVADALKTAINSVYGLTAANFDNKLRDPRNKDNIIAKYGALFMINLEEEVTKRGYKVVHIKTDSIKIAEATPEIIEFCMNYGKEYGFTFEHEATYEKMCILNDAVYIAKYADGEHEFELSTGEKVNTAWTATGKEFQVPYVFKTLFSHDPIKFADMCETFATTTALYLDMDPEGEHDYKFVGKVGEFTPVKPGTGGGVLLRQKDDKYYAATGTKKQGKIPKGEIDIYYWLESETVKLLKKEDNIDQSYYRYLVDNAIDDISNFGDFETFAN